MIREYRNPYTGKLFGFYAGISMTDEDTSVPKGGADGPRVLSAPLRRLPQTGAMFDIAGVSNENDEWYTPSWFFHALDIEFDLDPCSPGSPPSSVTAKRHLTKGENGLTAEWLGAVWLNPPFSSKQLWYERLVEHGNGIALMPARTDTFDLQTYMQAAQALLFVRGRICFERGTRSGDGGMRPTFGVVLCAYGEEMADRLLASQLMGVRAKVFHHAHEIGEKE